MSEADPLGRRPAARRMRTPARVISPSDRARREALLSAATVPPPTQAHHASAAGERSRSCSRTIARSDPGTGSG